MRSIRCFLLQRDRQRVDAEQRFEFPPFTASDVPIYRIQFANRAIAPTFRCWLGPAPHRRLRNIRFGLKVDIPSLGLDVWAGGRGVAN